MIRSLSSVAVVLFLSTMSHAVAATALPKSLAASGHYYSLAHASQTQAPYPPGVDWGRIESYSLNRKGEISFLTGLGVWTNSGSDHFRRVVALNEAATHDPSMLLHFRAPWQPVFTTDAGAVLLESQFRNQITQGEGIFIHSPSAGFSTLLATDMPLPGHPSNVVADEFWNLAVHPGGQYLFDVVPRDLASGAKLGGVLYHGNENGGLREVARTGEWVTGLAVGESIAQFGNPSPSVVNIHGEIIAPVLVQGPTVNDTNYYALLREDVTGLKVIAREGTPLGGPRDVVRNIRDFRINEQGTVVLLAYFGQGNASRLVTIDPQGTVKHLLSPGSRIPSGEVNVGVSSVDTYDLNTLGEMVAQVTLIGSGVSSQNDQALLYIDAAGKIDIIARENQIAPGFQAARFGSSIAPDLAFLGVQINDAGEILFNSLLRNGGLDEIGINANEAIWKLSPDRQMTMLLQKHDPIEFRPGFVENTALRGAILSETGSVLVNGFHGLFVIPPVRVPEPGTYGLVALGMWGAWRVRMRYKL